jgi:hypothetical protein
MSVRTPSPALIVASVALLLSLTGGAVAGALITGKQIKDNSVATADVTNNSLGSVDVKNESITTGDIKNGTLRTVDFASGQLPEGAPGPAGAPGAQGAPGISGLQIVEVSSASSSSSTRQIDVSCPAGKQVIGGGAQLWNAGSDVALDESFPKDATTWRATAYEVNATGTNWHLVAHAICATVAT